MRPCACSFADHVRLPVRQHFGVHFVDAQRARHHFRGRAIVAGQHDDSQAVAMQLFDRFPRRWLDRIGQAERARGLAVDRYIHHGLAGIVRSLPAAWTVSRPTTRRPSTMALTPCPVSDSKLLGLRQCQASLQRARDNRRRQRMLAQLLHAGRQSQHFIIGGRDQLRLALRQRSGFVHHQRVHFLQAFQRLGIADQHAGRRAAPGPHHDGHRRGQAQRARTRDDQYRNRVHQRVSQPAAADPRMPRRRTSRWRRRSPPARTPPTRDPPAAGWARAIAALRSPSARSAPAAFPRPRARPA